jgi:hypothetical protein
MLARAVLRWAVMRIDAWLRRRGGIIEFCNDRDCILRIGLAVTDRPVVLPGVVIDAGEGIIDLHLWNEQLPVGRLGPDLLWACRFRRRLKRSLELLAAAVATAPELARVQAVRADTAFVSRHRHRKLARIAARYGLAPPLAAGEPLVPPPRLSLWQIIWLCALALACNSSNRRRRSFFFQRERYTLWITREALLERFGPVLAETARGAPHQKQ